MQTAWSDPLNPHDLACRLAAYVPVTLTRRLVTGEPPIPGQSYPLTASTLFVDLSGFTSMSEELATDGPRGAEELSRVLLLTFGAMVAEIHQLGGAVAHFYGDAMGIYFPEEQAQENAAQRALACAHALQQLVTRRFRRVLVNRPLHKNPAFALTIKIGVGYGRCQEIVLGNRETGLEFVLMGTAVDLASQAEKQAQPGEIIASRTVLQQAGESPTADFSSWQTSMPPLQTKPIINMDAYRDDATCHRVSKYLTDFLSPALFERLTVTGPSDLAEHRPVTNLFVQFSFQNNDDDLDAGHLLHRYYRWVGQVVARFGQQNARINRVLTGDKGFQLHIIFGAPVAPDAPEQALRCALALQRERPPFVAGQKIGVTVGKVFAGPLGAEARREYTVVGDVVNTAARLTDLCLPGEVLTDEVTAERVRRHLLLEPLPPVSLRGKRLVVTPHRVQRDRLAATQLEAYYGRFHKPIIGRETELQQLSQRLDAALKGRGGVITISGAAGVGKTRLLAVGLKKWSVEGGKGFLGICYQHMSDNPFAPWRTIWAGFFNLSGDMRTDEQVTAVIEQTRALLPNVGEDVLLWGEVLGLPFPKSKTLQTLDAETRRARFVSLAQSCLQAASQQQPMLIILEGVQWADRASLDLLTELAPQLQTQAACMAITMRPEPNLKLPFLATEQNVTIELGDLSPQDAREYLKNQVGLKRLPPLVEQQLGLRDRDGRDSPVNPLFLEEALQVMMEMGVLEINGRIRVNEDLLAQMQVPDTIHGLLLARIDRLPAANRGMLQVASVIGRQFGLEPLDAITPEIPSPIVADLLGDLTAAQITQLVTTDPEWIYLFQHAMTHEVAYASLPYARRQALHAAIADWLLDRYSDNLKPIYPVLAHHYSQANIHEEGLRYALDAAKDARDIFANQEAIGLYNLAEKHLDVLGKERHWETAVEIYLARGQTHWHIGEYVDAIANTQKALLLAQKHQNTQLQAQAINLKAEVKYRQTHFREAVSLAQEVLALPEISARELARAHHWAGMAATALGQYDLGLNHLERAEKMSLANNDNQRRAQVLEGLAYIYYIQKNLEDARQTMRLSVDLSRDFSSPMNVASALNNIALIEFELGRAAAALDTINESLNMVQERNLGFRATVLGNRAEFLCYLGRYAEANISFAESESLLLGMDNEVGLVELYLQLSNQYYADLEDWAAVQTYLQLAQALIEARPQAYPEQSCRLLIGWGRVLLATNQLKSAREHLETAVALIREKNLPWRLPAALYYLAKVQRQQQSEKKEKIQQLFEQGLHAIEANGCPDVRPRILLELAHLAAHDLTERNRLLEACVQAAGERARYRDQVHCFKTAGSLLIQSAEIYWQQLGEQCLQEARNLSAQSGGNLAASG